MSDQRVKRALKKCIDIYEPLYDLSQISNMDNGTNFFGIVFKYMHLQYGRRGGPKPKSKVQWPKYRHSFFEIGSSNCWFWPKLGSTIAQTLVWFILRGEILFFNNFLVTKLSMLAKIRNSYAWITVKFKCTVLHTHPEKPSLPYKKQPCLSKAMMTVIEFCTLL